MSARRPRKIREPAARTPAESRGADFRVRRVALGLAPLDLGIPREVALRLPVLEDGAEQPPSDWPWVRLYIRLYVLLEDFVGRHLAAGGRWQDLAGKLPGWSIDNIRNAALTVRSRAELEAEDG